VPLTAGVNTLKVIATDPGGAQKQASITVNASINPDKATLTASPTAGILTMKASGQATLDVSFGATTYLQNPVVSYAWDFNGDGTVDLSCNDLSTVTASYLQIGLYLATVTVTDQQGNKYTDTVIVNVLDAKESADIFKAIWNRVKTSLMAGDIETALNDVIETSRDTYHNMFSELGNDEIKAILQQNTDLTLISRQEDDAECAAIHVETGGTYGYPVLFMKDENGTWKIRVF